MLSIVVIFRIKNEVAISGDYGYNLWDITLKSIQGIVDTADQHYELIVIDNGSYSPEFAAELNAKASLWFEKDHLEGFKLFRFESHESLSKVWNVATYQSDGEYVALCNNDIIYFEKGWMTKLLEPFSSPHIKAGIVGIQHMSWGEAGGFVEGSLFVFPKRFAEELSLSAPTDERLYHELFDEQFTFAADVDFNVRVKQAGYVEMQVNNPPLQPRWLEHLGHRTLNTLQGSSESVVAITHEDRIKLCRKWNWPDQIVD